MNPDDILKVFRQRQALLEGHFELASTRHSPFYLQCALILQYPDIAGQLCQMLADRFKNKTVDVVAGPAIGGIIIAYEIGRLLGVRSIYAERKEKILELRRGFEIKKGENVVLVEDVITTGGSIIELASLCEKMGGHVMGAGSLVDRTGGKSPLPFGLEALVKVDFPTYERNECPLCKKGLPLAKPGSQKMVGR